MCGHDPGDLTTTAHDDFLAINVALDVAVDVHAALGNNCDLLADDSEIVTNDRRGCR